MKRTQAQDRWLRFFNSAGYNALAPVYNAMDWLTLGAWWRLVRRALEEVPSAGRVLEVGFGPGRLHAELARRVNRLVGLDLAWGMCRFTARRLARAGLPAHLTRGSVFALPYRDTTFDTVVSTFAFSGIPNGAEALREMARVVTPGGRVVIVDISLPPDGNRLGTFWAHLWEQLGDYLYDQPALMESTGLRVVRLTYFGPGRHICMITGQKSA